MKETKTPANGQRIRVIDAIRGLAVLGILFANIQSWSGYKYILIEQINSLPYAQLEPLFYSLHLWLVDGKFYAIFSMLFGAGFGLQYVKNIDRMASFLPIYRRRLCFLVLFGIAHTILWSGDILTLYALLAFVMVFLRGTPTRAALLLAVSLLVFFSIPQMLMLLFGPETPPASPLAHKVYPDATPQQLSAAFGGGTWSEVIAMNLHNVYWRWHDFLPNGRISRVLGFFMLGFYLARSGYFTRHISSLRLLVFWACTGLALTYLAMAMDANMTRWASSWSEVAAKLVLVAGQVALAFFYLSAVGMLYENRVGKILLHPLTLIGRMAFTNYLMQSLIGITLFYGVGLGYYGSMGLAQLWLLALAIYAGQVLFSSFWLTFFKQGPVEWLWGCLTKKRITTNRKFLVGHS